MTSVPEHQADDDDVGDLSFARVGATEETPVSSETTNPPGLRAPRKRTLFYGITGIAALLVVSFGAVRFFSRSNSSLQPGAGTSQPLNAAQLSPQNAAQVPLRLLAGYEGSPRIDSAGAYWQADRFFHGGGAFRRPDVPVTRTSDPMLFEQVTLPMTSPLRQGPMSCTCISWPRRRMIPNPVFSPSASTAKRFWEHSTSASTLSE